MTRASLLFIALVLSSCKSVSPGGNGKDGGGAEDSSAKGGIGAGDASAQGGQGGDAASGIEPCKNLEISDFDCGYGVPTYRCVARGSGWVWDYTCPPLPDAGVEAVRDAPARNDVSVTDASEDEPVCWSPDVPLPAAGPCSTAIRACAKGWDECLFSAPSTTLAILAGACGMGCGEFYVGFVAGCAAEVRAGQGILPEPCLSIAILGQRWTCTPENGWVRVFVGSCTLP
jgi:hypothetical protein